jgi:hypothetical protein
MATLADFRARFTEFSSISDEVVELNLSDAALEVSVSFGDYQDVATLFLAAHYLALSQNASNGAYGSVGGLSSKSVDGVSQSFNVVAANSQSDQLLAYTVYGQRFLSYRQKIALGNVMVV